MIGEFAFRGCEQLKEIYIPKGVSHISRGLFRDCKSLEKIVLDNRREIDFRKANGFLTGAPEAKKMFTETLYSKDARLNPLEYNILKENKADWQLSTIGISKGGLIWRKYISTNDMKNSF